MKKRHLPVIALPLLLAIGLMSMPAKANEKLRNALAQKALVISRTIQSKTKELSSKNNIVQQWLKEQSFISLQASERASALAPFSVLPDAQSSDYIVASVLFRNPSRWNSSLWINKGFQDSPYIQKNSPVLSGDSVIGVIDFVGKNASCVRLITDSGLSCAVRVARGAKDRNLAQALIDLQDALDEDKLPFKSDEEKTSFMWMVHHLQQAQKLPKEPEFLAKGVLQGHGEALWKAKTCRLVGIGFNYDFKDQHGPSRDLRTGEAIDPLAEYVPKDPTPIVQTGDLLVTSGMDGVFPEGLKVAKVQSIKPLTEGAFTYELYAIPTASDILNVSHVIILPPQNFDADNLPKQLDLILDQLSDV